MNCWQPKLDPLYELRIEDVEIKQGHFLSYAVKSALTIIIIRKIYTILNYNNTINIRELFHRTHILLL